MSSRKKTVVVAGDAAIDWFFFPIRPKDEGDNWQLHAAVRPSVLPGGSLLLADFIRGAIPEGAADVFKQSMTVHLSKITPKQLIHSNAMLEFFRLVQDSDEGEALRVKDSLGFVGPDQGTPHSPPPEPNPEAADIVVLDDTGNGFRDEKSVWPAALHPDSQALVVHKICRPIAKGALWQEVTSRHLDRHIVIVNADDLRCIPEVDLSRSFSWERTAKDFVYQIIMAQELSELKNIAYLIVLFGVDGAIIRRGGKGAQSTLVFDADNLEGGFDKSVEGTMYGLSSIFTSAIVAALVEGGVTRLEEGVRHGLGCARELLRSGFQLEGHMLSYPTSDMLSDVSTDDYASCPIEPPQDLSEADRHYWRILDQRTRNTRRLVAEQIIVEGKSDGLSDVPIGRFGKLETIDRAEIESFSAIRELILEFLHNPKPPRPLCFAVFGPPGAGKSFGIKQVLASIRSEDLRTETFNVSQFREYRDLVAALHRVRDIALGGHVPFVFFDEFDSANGKKSLGWLQYFLAPMQDGEFRDGEDIHPVGKAIFVFAGGTRSSFAKFSAGDDSQDGSKKSFKNAKGPDFVSRLRGYIDIMGPNRREAEDQSDDAFIIRRAKVLRAMLEFNAKASQMFDSDKKLRIDVGVLRALLNVSKYKHGTRSMEAIYDMSRLTEKRRFDLACLPPRDQLQLHVDADEFLFLALRERFCTILCDTTTETHSKASQREWEAKLVEKATEKIHEHYLADRQREGVSNESTVPFGELSTEIQESNRDAARDIPQKLRSVNHGIRRIREGCDPRTPDLSDEEVEQLAQMEHERWCRERILQGYEYSKHAVPGKKTSPHLKLWDELPRKIQLYNVHAIYKLPLILKDLGYELVRMEEVEDFTDDGLLKKLASTLHQRYFDERTAEGDTVETNPALVPFEELPPDLKAANVDNAKTIPRKLYKIGYGLRPILPDEEPALLELSDEEITRMAKVEHARWNWQKILQGWTCKEGPKDPDNQTTPYLVPWVDLPSKIQQYDVEPVSMIPPFIRDAGYVAYKL